MSKIRDIHAAFGTLIEATLPGYIELTDSIDVSENSAMDLEKGYSINYGSASNESDNFCKGEIRVQRVLTVVLTNTYVANLDVAFRNDMEGDLIDDHTALIAATECNITLDGAAMSVQYSNDGGLEYMIDDVKQYIVILSDFTVDYIEEV